MQKVFFPVISIALCTFIVTCGGPQGPKLKEPDKGALPKRVAEDTLSDDLQCSVVVNGKAYNVPADSIATGYTFSDSSLVLTFKGVGGGRVVLSVPNMFNCPCSIASGYSSVRFKIAGSDEYSTEPTVELYNYGKPGISFNNLDDGLHKNEAVPHAAAITSIRKINENTTTNWAEYLIKGKIHTTVLKNVYESAAGDLNRDYSIEAGFVLQAKIYF